MDVLVDHALQQALCAQDVFDRIAHRSVTAFMRGNVMRFAQHLRPRVLHRNSQAAQPHHRQIDNVITDVADLLGRQAFLLQNFLKGGEALSCCP